MANIESAKPVVASIFEVTTLQNGADSEAIERISDSITYTSRGRSIAAAMAGFGYPAVAVVSMQALPRILETPGTPKHRLELRVPSFALNLEDEDHRRALGSVVIKAVRAHLRKHLGSTLWQRSERNRIFCQTTPLKVPDLPRKRTSYEFDLFRGFQYRIDVFPDGRLGLTLDLHSTVLD
ncbi:MAG: hypothetical protein ACUVT7_09615, partial [Thermoplasmata archaeon]